MTQQTTELTKAHWNTGVSALMGAVDNMTELDLSEVRDGLFDLFIKAVNALNRNEDDFEPNHVAALASACREFSNEDFVTGKEAETLYHDSYQEIWRQDFGQDTENWNGEIDWCALCTPRSLLIRVAHSAAVQDAVNQRAWLKWVSQNPERLLMGQDTGNRQNNHTNRRQP